MDGLIVKISDISDLITKLRHERLLVTEERKIIQNLNEKLKDYIDNLMQNAWINSQQRINLNTLVITRADFTPEQCSKRTRSIARSSFVQAKEILDYQAVLHYGDFLRLLRNQPEQLAHWLVIGERLTEDSHTFSDILHSLVTGLYGSILLPEDTNLMLCLLKQLAYLQLVSSDNPKRLLRQGSCVFAKMYFLFHENLYSAKLFLIAALQNPLLKLIAKSDFYLDIDLEKSISRFSASEKAEKFGTPGTAEYNAKISMYRSTIVKNLVEITNSFINSLHENIYCFPKSLAWLICQVAKMMTKSFGQNSKEVNAVSTDLIFTLFVCPAIVHPEPYGICDAPISEMARHNLMQVGQILQILSLIRFETPDQKLMDLYSFFNTEVVSGIVSILLQNNGLGEKPPIQKLSGIPKTVALFTEQDLYNLVTFLQKVNTDNNLLSNSNGAANYCGRSNMNNMSSLDHLVALVLSLSDSQENLNQASVKSVSSSPVGVSKRTLLNKVTKSHLNRSQSANSESDLANTTVLIIPLQQDEHVPVGLFSEQKVLNLAADELCNSINEKRPELPNGDLNSGQEKRTRFSNSHDDGSIGNTSDNLEAISEAASNHSVDSSIELENEDQNDNDNLSDMVSANVSGRGSPNISGRDTPSSQVTENEDRDVRAQAEVRQQFLQQPHHMNKQIRSEIDDKFCKFEIKKLLEGDETISIISDTWSTDVLASDSETIDAADGRQDHQNFSPIVEQPLDHMSNPLLDISETQSESAWSMDVLTSDTERLTEVDNDDLMSVAPSDAGSVARSDDAASVAPSDDASRSELDETANGDRRSSAPNSTNPFLNSIDRNSYGNSNFQEYQRMDMTTYNLNKADLNEFNNNVVVESLGEPRLIPASYEDSLVTQMQKVLRLSNSPVRRDVIDLNISKINELQCILNKRPINLEGAGPSGINKSNSDELVGGLKSTILVSKSIRTQKYEERQDIQLSNCSLNSSSSGSSNSSETQNKNTNYGAHKNGHQAGKMWLNGSESSLNITSTPSESTSELSVLSANTLVSPISNNPFLDQKTDISNPKVLKASMSTGAIPKSISFDMSADKGYKELDDDQKNKRGGFFGKIRMGFKSRRGKIRSNDDYTRMGNGDEDTLHLRRGYTEFTNKSMNFAADNSEDILAKYRNKTIENGQLTINSLSAKPIKSIDVEDRELKMEYGKSDFVYTDCKRKLRLVLSDSQEQCSTISKDSNKDVKKYLEVFLQLELAKARSLKQWPVVARTAEALRCVRLLDTIGCHKLFEMLKEDYCRRSVYIQYILQSKQTLLSTEAYLKLLEEQLICDKELCDIYLVEVSVRFFLEKQEPLIQKFCVEFQNLKLVDEKNDHLSSFLQQLHVLLHKDPLWQDSARGQINLAHIAIEQSVISKVYVYALYPNGDGDRDRDSVLSDHLKKLSKIITPNHKDLLINKLYLNECPWLPAQEALQAMAAYRTPRDKVRCVTRCTTSIMDLLSLAQDRGSTTADDFIPVLVYVIIKANPQDLLSTIQYVNSFYNNQLTGEDSYWWTQFCSAVEYTKTMDYSY